ncbi:MAG: hypothetical protein NUV67_05655, partial [archaeon]|nr:hypothetical protein [archaeon]
MFATTEGERTAPSVPGFISNSILSDTSIRINWFSEGAASYKIYRSTTGLSGTYSFLAADSASPYDNTSLASGTQYCYKVSAIGSTGLESAQSAGTCGVPRSLAPPTGLSITYLDEGRYFRMFWNAPAGTQGESVTYQFAVMRPGGEWTTWVGASESPLTSQATHGYGDFTWPVGSQFKVRAKIGTAYSAYSSP